VVASYLTVAAAVLLAWTITELPRVRHRAARVLRVPDIAPSGTDQTSAERTIVEQASPTIPVPVPSHHCGR
jgi:hypothetical protein